ncbi:hypothetical protein [Streptomyces sp. NPDC059649]|uniref:hypothetical protein n=1 Tax=Streptomyces sp. NPDC059649 TaxID=3346895 RepID=UPI00368E1065
MTGLALQAPYLALQAFDLHLARLSHLSHLSRLHQLTELSASDLAHHLLVDFALKILIVVVALVVLGLGMTVIWRRVGRAEERQPKNDE